MVMGGEQSFTADFPAADVLCYSTCDADTVQRGSADVYKRQLQESFRHFQFGSVQSPMSAYRCIKPP